MKWRVLPSLDLDLIKNTKVTIKQARIIVEKLQLLCINKTFSLNNK